MKYWTATALLGLADAMHFGFFGCPTIADDKLHMSSLDTAMKDIFDAGNAYMGGKFTNFPASFLGTEICYEASVKGLKDADDKFVNYELTYGHTSGWNPTHSE